MSKGHCVIQLGGAQRRGRSAKRARTSGRVRCTHNLSGVGVACTGMEATAESEQRRAHAPRAETKQQARPSHA
eukprot:6179609-Pleurochrysis_carterae.AAC.1